MRQVFLVMNNANQNDIQGQLPKIKKIIWHQMDEKPTPKCGTQKRVLHSKSIATFHHGTCNAFMYNLDIDSTSRKRERLKMRFKIIIGNNIRNVMKCKQKIIYEG